MEAEVGRVAIYARCSAQRQADKDLSIPAQLDSARAEAKRRGWEVVAEFIDEAESATSADRPQFQEMIAAARQKPAPFETILVWKLSRFARSREDSVLYKAMLRRNGVSVVSINERIDDTPTGRMLEGILESVDEFYSANLAQDTVRGLRKNASRGYRNGGRPPTGYCFKRTGDADSPKSVLEPDPEWGPLVKRIFAMALAGEGASSIASTFDGEGLRTPRGKRWMKQGILAILRNEVYVGVTLWGKKRTGRQRYKSADPVRVEGTHPPLVSRADFDTVQALMKQRSPKQTHPRRLASPYLLTGLLYCAHCGSPLIGHPAKSGAVHYYGCQRKMKTGAKACPAKLLNRDRTEAAVVKALRELVLVPRRLGELVALVNQALEDGGEERREERGRLDAQLKGVRGKLGRLYSALEEGALELEDLAPRLRARKEEARGLEERLAALTSDPGAGEPLRLSEEEIVRYARDLGTLLSEGSLNTRKAFLRMWVRRIDVEGYDLTLTHTLPPLPVLEDGYELDGRPSPSFEGWAEDPEDDRPIRYISMDGERVVYSDGREVWKPRKSRGGRGGRGGRQAPERKKAETRGYRVLPMDNYGSPGLQRCNSIMLYITESYIHSQSVSIPISLSPASCAKSCTRRVHSHPMGS